MHQEVSQEQSEEESKVLATLPPLPDKGDIITSGGAKVHYEYTRIRRGGPFTAPSYRTQLWVYNGTSRYNLGVYEGKLDAYGIESAISVEAEQGANRYDETTRSSRRAGLTPVRERSTTLNPRTSIAAGYKPYG